MLDVLGCYFRATYRYRDEMVALVLEDAKTTGTPLSPTQAENLVKGIWWKNTQENFAHFGLITGRSTQLLEDMITNIGRVLRGTGAMERDPTSGQPTVLFFDGLLKKLQNSQFHPGLDTETVRDDTVELPPLSDQQWQQLTPIGTLAVPPLVFARGTDRLTESSQAALDELVGTLQTFPYAYVLVRGNASKQGDLQANRELAEKRAAAAERYLVQAGVSANRVRAVAGEPSGATSVTFVLGQPPY